MDQSISKEELKQFVYVINKTVMMAAAVDSKLMAMVDVADKNGDQLLTSDEMLSIIMPADANGKCPPASV